MIWKIALSVFAGLLALDVVMNLFGGKNAGSMTNALCKPFFGLFYEQLHMFSGLILWLIEFAIIISAIWIWFI